MAEREELLSELSLDVQEKVKPPSLFEVVLLNDDVTTMDFVVEVLQRFFDKSWEDAYALMWKVHKEGEAVAAVRPFEIAQMLVFDVMNYARDNNFPLKLNMRPQG